MAYEDKNENEKDEIEQHLVEKISYAIDRLDDQQNLVTKFYLFQGDFRDLLNALKIKNKQIDKGDWSSVRRSNLYFLNNLVTEWQLLKNQSSFFVKEVIESCENIKKSVKKMKKEIEGKESSLRGDRDGSTHHQEPHHPSFQRFEGEVHRWSSRFPPKKVHGSDHRVLAMERDLVMRNVDAPFKAFGVVGAAGIGKTTLCQTIFSRDSMKQRFCPRIWVCLSNQPRGITDYRKDIVIRILKNLGIEDEVINDAGKDHDHIQQQPPPVTVTDAGGSQDQIKQVPTGGDETLNRLNLKRLILLLRLQLKGKRYLIILDDAWNNDENVVKFFSNLNKKEKLDENWGEELAYGLPKGCGGTVISSSTSKALLEQMLGEDAGFQHLTPHTDETIYAIFKDTVVGYDEDEKVFPPYLEELKGEILKKCEGNPLAAKLLAKIARERLDFKSKTEGSQEIKQIPGGGVEQLTGGGNGGHRSGLLPVRSDQME